MKLSVAVHSFTAEILICSLRMFYVVVGTIKFHVGLAKYQNVVDNSAVFSMFSIKFMKKCACRNEWNCTFHKHSDLILC